MILLAILMLLLTPKSAHRAPKRKPNKEKFK